MAKRIHRLNALKVKQEKTPGWYADGAGLYLQVSPNSSKSWVYRYQMAGKERRHGLGSYPDISLTEARDAASACRKLVKEGIDPIKHKKEYKLLNRLKSSQGVSFKQCALEYIDLQKPGWKNQKHAAQWNNTLHAYAFPVIGHLPVSEVTHELVLEVLQPIWNHKTETASRVRQRIENILDFATVKKLRQGDNPARWKGNLDKILPKRTKVQKVKHFAAMPYKNLPSYFKHLDKINSTSAYALAFTILTIARSSGTRYATWDEIDMKSRVWILPEERMKAEKLHRVPLSPEAITILRKVKKLSHGEYVFEGIKPPKPISDSAQLNLLKKSHPDLTVHGFRSTFRDWCAEMTAYPREVAEAAMAHSIKDKTEAAYQRGDIFEKRKKLMDAWGKYCYGG